MKIINTVQVSREEIARILTKPLFDEVKLSPSVQAGVKRIFGRDMSAGETVTKIVSDVRNQGLEAVLFYTESIDGVKLSADTLEAGEQEYADAYQAISDDVLTSIRRAVVNVRAYHLEQMPKSWLTYRPHGAMLGQNCTPLDCVGIYAPGGTASYPSSVIMNAVPAVVAGVREIIMTVPPGREGTLPPAVLVAAREAGVTRVFKIGGAQAIAALAFGAGPVPKVDKITGPGNIFVTLAKKAVYGYCGIDMLAGPSEILIVADGTANPSYVAADMLSQAEHDPLASSILLTDSITLAQNVESELKSRLAGLPRRDIAETSLGTNGLIVITKDIPEAMELANMAAPEHLEILTAQPFALLPFVRNAGAIFLGPYSPEPLGDYMAGPNHVLPTGGTARFFSVLNVETFMKKTSIIAYTKEALAAAGPDVIRLAEAEGLQAHANAIRVRSDE